jgi:threonine dehydratase
MRVDDHAVREALVRIDSHVVQTPIIRNDTLDQRLGLRLSLKGEHLQPVGSFKVRGAANMVLSQSPDALIAGVCTHSSGNHGAALAWIAKVCGIPAYIVVPRGCSSVKKQLAMDLGATVIECEPGMAAREAKLAEVAGRTHALYVPPYNASEIIAGQGTTLLELQGQTSQLDALIVPVGGGGLFAGCCLVKGSTQVFGAEPAGADDAFRSLATDNLVREQEPDTLCDGLRATLGSLNFEIIRAHGAGVFLASEEAIVFAMQLIWRLTKQFIEPSSAVTLAVLLENRAQFQGQHVGLILTGGNVDMDALRSQLLSDHAMIDWENRLLKTALSGVPQCN